MAREAGADAVIDFRAEDVGARIAELTNGKGADRLIEAALREKRAALSKDARQEGTVIVYGAGGTEGRDFCRLGHPESADHQFIYMYELPRRPM